jgi:hypothetical protein
MEGENEDERTSSEPTSSQENSLLLMQTSNTWITWLNAPEFKKGFLEFQKVQ